MAALRPSLLDDLGLLSAIRSLVAQVTREGQLGAELTAPGMMAPLAREGELVLFRAVQEAITNVQRHARATQMQITIAEKDETVFLTVDDDGIGPPSRTALAERERGGHMGLVGMRERLMALGGGMSIEASPLGGMRLSVVLPAARRLPVSTS
jgi:two-component system, NarL family, sensor histidine kinase UhpB